MTLDISDNYLRGGIPAGAGNNFVTDNSSVATAALLVLEPMRGPGLCGAIPDNMNVTSQSHQRLQGVLQAGACPGILLFWPYSETVCPFSLVQLWC